jgi:thioredoxin-related protein
MVRIAILGALLAAAARADVTWLRDLEKAKDRAVAEDKLVFILFDAEECEPCRQMEEDTFPRPDVRQWLGGVVCVRIRVDTDSGDAIATKFGIEGIPTIVLLEPSGRVLYNKGGRPEPEHFVDFLMVEEWNAAVDACNIKDPTGAAPHLFFVRKWFADTRLGKEAEGIYRELEKVEGFKAAYDAAQKAYDDSLAAVRKAREELLAEEREAARKQQERRARARQLKAEADELHRKYMRSKAYDLYRKILAECPDCPEAKEARAILERNKQRTK